MKRTNRNRFMALVLAAVLTISAIAVNPVKASAAIEINPYETAETVEEITNAVESLLNRISDKDLEKMKKVGIQTLTALLGEFVPGGKTMGPAVQELLGTAFLNKQTSMDDINENINGLYGRIDRFEEDMQNELKNIISIENFDYALFTPFNSEIQGIINSVKNIQDSNMYTEKQKLAIIGAQIDADIEWKKGNSPFVAFTSVTNKINSSNLVDGKDMFTAVYDYFKQRSMFSAEAIDKSRAVLDNIMKNYMAGYTVLLECLTAQLMVNALENKEGIDEYYLGHISTNISEIISKINELNRVVMGTVHNGVIDKSGTVSEKYNRILNINRRIFVNKGKDNIEYCHFLDVTNHGSLWSSNEDMGVGSFKSEVWNRDKHLSGSQIKDIAEFAKGKGMTVREYLAANDIYVANAPQNTYLATSEAYDDFSAVDLISGIIGSIHLHGFYKGINIDEKNPAEKEVLFWNHGCNGYCASTWDFAEPGNAATIPLW